MIEAPRDPRANVEAPVIYALELIVARGAATFAVAVVTVLLAVVASPGPLEGVAHFALPSVLVFIAAARAFHVLRTQGEYVETADVWSRAAAIDRPNALFAAVVAVLVPAAWLVGGASILVRHIATPEELAAVVGVWAPLGAASWIAATLAWNGDCRERLGRALAESDRRFRRYWAELGRSA